MTTLLKHLSISQITAFGNDLCACDIVHELMDCTQRIPIVNICDKHQRSKQKPWGIYISNDLRAHSESELPILTLCNLSLRNENSHRATDFEHIPYRMRYILKGSNAV